MARAAGSARAAVRAMRTAPTSNNTAGTTNPTTGKSSRNPSPNPRGPSPQPVWPVGGAESPTQTAATENAAAGAKKVVEPEAAGSTEALAALQRLRESLPLSEPQVSEVAALVVQITTSDLTSAGLAAPARPELPPHVEKLPAKARLAALQAFISAFQYNHTPSNYFNLLKRRPFARVMDTAKDIVRRALPIKCLEAVFLGLYLTAGMKDLDRIPIGFKTCVQGASYRHIVLAIRHRPSKLWGAVGLSRREELMFKELRFDSLAALLEEYKVSYERWWHTLQKVRVGLVAAHDTFNTQPLCWRYFCYKVSRARWERQREEIDAHAAHASSVKLYDKWLRTGETHTQRKKRKAGVPAAPPQAARKESEGRAPPSPMVKKSTPTKQSSAGSLAQSPYAKKSAGRTAAAALDSPGKSAAAVGEDARGAMMGEGDGGGAASGKVEEVEAAETSDDGSSSDVQGSDSDSEDSGSESEGEDQADSDDG